MAPKKKLAPIGWNPIDAGTALGIQSKAVFKYTKLFFKGNTVFENSVSIHFAGQGAVWSWN